MLEDLKIEVLKYEMAEEFLADLRKKFEGEEEKTVKTVELRRLEQDGKTMKDFVQEFRRSARKKGNH